MAGVPVPDRPNTQSNASPWFKVLVSRRCAHPDDEKWVGYLGCFSSALQLPGLASPTARRTFSKGSGNDSRLGNLDSPVLGAVSFGPRAELI